MRSRRPAGTAAPEKGGSRSLRQWVPVYTSAVTAVGAIIAAAALANLPQDWLGLLVLAGLAAAAELLSVQLFRTSRSWVSASSIVAMAGILSLGPLAGALIHMVGGVVTSLSTVREQSTADDRASWVQRAAFNAAMFVAATAAAGWVYVSLGGTPGIVYRASNVLPLIAAATADWFVNAVLLLGVIILQTGRSPISIWRRDFQWTAPISILGGVLGGGALALGYAALGILGVAVFYLPVLAVGYSFRLYVRNMEGYVENLEQANARLEDLNLGLLETLGAVVDAYDVYTYGHSAQVAEYSDAIAQKMRLAPAERATIVKAALVHDVGKVGVTDTIIGKTGKLTDEEFALVKRHAVIGAEIVGQMPGFEPLVPLVRHHHERWDGAGYPDGLEGEEIPIGARVLAVADSLDAMLSDRPYRQALAFTEALREISTSAGTQFDPDVVKAFFAVVTEKDRDFFVNSAATVARGLEAADHAGAEQARAFLLKKSKLLTDVRANDAGRP